MNGSQSKSTDMDTWVASLRLEEISHFLQMTEPEAVDTVFRSYKPMKQVLLRLIMPMMAELSVLFFIIDYFDLVKSADNTYRVDIHYLDTQFQRGLKSFELGGLESEIIEGGDSSLAP